MPKGAAENEAAPFGIVVLKANIALRLTFTRKYRFSKLAIFVYA